MITFLTCWALLIVGLSVVFAGARQGKWWLLLVGTIFSASALYLAFHPFPH